MKLMNQCFHTKKKYLKWLTLKRLEKTDQLSKKIEYDYLKCYIHNSGKK